MNTLQHRIADLKSATTPSKDDPEELFAVLDSLAAGSLDTPSKDRTPQNEVEGCQSQLWLTFETVGNLVQCTSWSESLITRTIVSLLAKTLSGVPIDDLEAFDMTEFLEACNLQDKLSMRRKNILMHIGLKVTSKETRFVAA